MSEKNLSDLFVDTLKDIYYAEKQIYKSLPKMAKAAASDQLREAFEKHHAGVAVQTFEVYWVGRHTSVPLTVGGVWFDFLYFDGHDRLLGFDREFVD